ncbi:MAG: N-6 DNA methylase, partial [Bacteroidia bacterium]
KEFRFAKGGFYKTKVQGKEVKIPASDLQKVEESELTRIFKQAHDALWAGGELNPSQAFDELNKLIFCKIWDEKYSKKGQPYAFQVISDDSEALKTKVIELYQKGREKNQEVFDKPIELSAQRIKIIVEYFQWVNLVETDLDSKGKAFETFLGSYFRGNFGQFFTPRNVIQLVIDVLAITNEHRVLDTSCGSGGFLLYALDKVRKQATLDFPEYENNTRDYADWKRQWHDFAEKNLYGIEINDQISRVAKMSMIIHDDGHTNVICHDGLFEPEVIVKNTENKGFQAESFDFIITNPPFGSIIKQSEKAYMKITQITNPDYVPTYYFATKESNWIEQVAKPKNALTGRENQSTEILFIEQCYKFLKPHAYLAVVIPDGILTNSSLQYVRNRIEKWFRIVGVVSLPQTAFMHTGAGVKSSVLFLKKYSLAETQQLEAGQDRLIQQLAQQNQIAKTLEDWEKQKKEELKPLLKDKSEQADAQRKAINEKYADKVNAFKEQLESDLQAAKQSQLFDYPIFMAIAEHIGYDATGKKITQNDLPAITEELKRFIEAIETGKDTFFV